MNSRQAAALQMESNPLQKAMENYQELERQWHETRTVNDDLRANNAALLSEVGMLRDLLMAADADRVRWQATAATLLGRLYAINDVVGGAVKAAIRDGLEATQPEERKACIAIAERTPSRHWKTILRSRGTSSARDARRSSSMCRAPGIRPASHS